MFKSATLAITAPFVKSHTKVAKKSSPRSATISWAGAKPGSSSRGATVMPSAFSVASLLLVVAIASLLLLHLFWVNTYSAKGFELTKVQTAITEQTELNKKLLIQQSMLSSSVSLSDLGSTGLVPVTDEEHLNSNSFASVK